MVNLQNTISSIGGGYALARGLSEPEIIYQGAPTALTSSTTLTAAQLGGTLLTANAGTGAAVTYTVPLATAMDTAFPNIPVNFSFEFVLTNISTVAAEDATIATNTGWTLLGNMVVNSNDTATSWSTGRFVARRVAAGSWTLQRV